MSHHDHIRIFHRALETVAIVPAQLYGAPPMDHRSEEVELGLTFGERTVERPLDLNTPVLLSAGADGQLQQDRRDELITAAGDARTAVNCGWPGITNDEKEVAVTAGARVISELIPARMGADMDTIRRADAVVLSLVHGGSGSAGGAAGSVILPGDLGMKPASAVGITGDGPIISPVRLFDMDTPRDLNKLIQLAREITYHEVPVMLKLIPGRIYNDIRIAVAAKPDGVIVDCTSAYTESGGQEAVGAGVGGSADAQMGLPALGVLPQISMALKESKAEAADVKLLVEAELRSGADVFKIMAFGAAGVLVTPARNISVSAMLKDMTSELKAVTAWTGHDSTKKIGQDDLRAITYDTAAITGLKLAGYDKALAMWEH